MADVTMLDAIESVLAERRADRPSRAGHVGSEAMAIPSSRLELADLDRIAARHFSMGMERGYEDGHRAGERVGVEHGGLHQRAQDVEVMVAIFVVLSDRLEGLQEALGVQEGEKGGKDTRTRSELREEAVAGLDAIRAGLAVVGVKLADGEL